MPEKDFQQEVIDRLARIETKQDMTGATVAEQARTLIEHGKSLVEVDARARSAHHRIDGIYAAAGVLGAVAGGIVQAVSALWKGGGH